MVGFTRLDSARPYDGVLSRVRVDTLRGPDGSHFTREVVEHVNAVAVVPVDGDDVILVRQYRHAVGADLLEIPAGICDVAGEPAAVTAARELAEEAHLAAGTLQQLTVVYNSAGWTDETTTVFLGRALSPVDPPAGYAPEGEEAHLSVVRMPLAEALEAAADGRLRDAKTVIGLLAAGRVLDREAARAPRAGEPAARGHPDT